MDFVLCQGRQSCFEVMYSYSAWPKMQAQPALIVARLPGLGTAAAMDVSGSLYPIALVIRSFLRRTG
ncbi:MAG: hypothetical protein F8N36_06020 [Desulfovibrio sp.]|uniref:hypothetical protein n=1 Tax=Desulfovibrio sp. TaxID=885 RepID=UPI00135D5112|nr:hypothetical protein [Desulfovibrio sp.]MTJ92405.1 hypothetical protein [Desulfovibrio sp.]